MSQSDSFSEQTLKATPLVSNLSVPWDMELVDDTHILFTELSGTISLLDLESKKVKEIKRIKEVANELQAGLLGMALHPDFKTMPHVFIAYTYYKKDMLYLKLVEYSFKKEKLKFVKNIIEDIHTIQWIQCFELFFRLKF